MVNNMIKYGTPEHRINVFKRGILYIQEEIEEDYNVGLELLSGYICWNWDVIETLMKVGVTDEC
jgi:hypothetical protein